MKRSRMDNLDSNVEFSYPIEVSNIPSGGRRYKLSASEKECAAIAKRLELKKLIYLTFDVALNHSKEKKLHVEGAIEAEIVQSCVISLTPVSSRLFEKISISFVNEPPGSTSKKQLDAEHLINMDEDDPPELVIDGRIDLGEMAVVQLILALDPYPRAEGANFNTIDWTAEEGGEASYRAKSFAALEKLKNNKQN